MACDTVDFPEPVDENRWKTVHFHQAYLIEILDL